MAQARASLFMPVQLQITKEEPIKRLTRPDRKERGKSINLQDAEDNGPLLSISHSNFLGLEISHLCALTAAECIMHHIKVAQRNEHETT